MYGEFSVIDTPLTLTDLGWIPKRRIREILGDYPEHLKGNDLREYARMVASRHPRKEVAFRREIQERKLRFNERRRARKGD